MSTTSETTSLDITESISFHTVYTDVVRLLGSVLKDVGISAIYMAQVKNIQVRGQDVLGVYVMRGVQPRLFWHNWADEYQFTLTLYSVRPAFKRTVGFRAYDNAVKGAILYRLTDKSLKNGGSIIGYEAREDWTAMKNIRGITQVTYDIKVLVMYAGQKVNVATSLIVDTLSVIDRLMGDFVSPCFMGTNEGEFTRLGICYSYASDNA